MKKRTAMALVVVALICAAAFPASAQLRLDLNVNIPLYFGASAGDFSGGVWNSYFIPFPEAQLAYQFGEGDLHGGVGFRAFTFIIETVLFPSAFVEVTFDRLVLTGNLGGFLFVHFGLLSAVLDDFGLSDLSGFQSVMIPDLNVSYKVTDWFRVGAGIFMVAPFGGTFTGALEGFVYSGYVQAKFVLNFE